MYQNKNYHRKSKSLCQNAYSSIYNSLKNKRKLDYIKTNKNMSFAFNDEKAFNFWNVNNS